MFQSIRFKLVASYFAVALLTSLFIFALMQLTSGGRMRQLVIDQRIASGQEFAANWYAANQTWDGFAEFFREETQGPPRQASDSQNDRPAEEGGTGSPPGFIGFVDAEHKALMPMFGVERGEMIPNRLIADALPVLVDGETVGYVAFDQDAEIRLAVEEERFLARTNQILFLSVIGGLLLAFAMGYGLSRVLVKPIQSLTTAARSMAAGDLEQQVPIQSADELGELATAFNQMSHDLAGATQQRRQLTADIAHDLSTPLQIISGYIEAAQDGELALTPARIDTIAGEIKHLSRLIEDLDLLAQADTQSLLLRIEPIDLGDFSQRVEAAFAPLAAAESINLTIDIDQAIPAVSADDERLMQVVGNLIKNALRYTPAEGDIMIIAYERTNRVWLEIKDSGKGIDAADLPYIFDRFYRADSSRSEGGKMGLGLAISKALVEAMGGKISAQSYGDNAGSTFTIALPKYG